jgi:hypothetical protein
MQRLLLYPRLHSGFGIGVGVYFARAFRITVEQPFRSANIQMWASDAAPVEDTIIVTNPIDVDTWLDQLHDAPISVEISISRDVHDGVDKHLHTLTSKKIWQRLKIAPVSGPSLQSVPDNAHATAFANQISDIIRRIRDQRHGTPINLFASMPLGLEILLGLQLNACKPLRCYGYDKDSNTYYLAYELS